MNIGQIPTAPKASKKSVFKHTQESTQKSQKPVIAQTPTSPRKHNTPIVRHYTF